MSRRLAYDAAMALLVASLAPGLSLAQARNGNVWTATAPAQPRPPNPSGRRARWSGFAR